MDRRSLGVALFVALFALTSCADDDGQADTSDGTSAVDSSGSADSTGGCEPMDVMFADVDESPCAPLATDFVPGEDDMWPACVADSGEWTPVEDDPPGAADRSVAYDDILALLRSGTTPTADDFNMARTRYAVGEGLESRLVRREDVHFPVIPMADQDPGVDFDKQCTVADNTTAYPDRCAGPAKMAPLINDAFDAGTTGMGDPNVHAARIDAGIAWFMFASTYKEMASCVQLPDNCDSSRGYFQGAEPRDQPNGLGKQIRDISPMAYNAVYDGMLALRCWRDLYPGDMDPTWEELMTAGQDAFASAQEQLDNALWYAMARLVREHIVQQPAECGSAADANWAYLKVLGPVLAPEAERRNSVDATTLAATFAAETPPAPDVLQACVAAIDALFPCPQCDNCTVEGYPY